MKLQQKHSSLLDVRDLIPHRTTVSRHVHTQAATEHDILKEILMSESKVSFTTDMWTEQHSQKSYLAITAHWITDDWQLVSRVICTKEHDSALKKTAANIHAALQEVFEEYGIGDRLASSVITTDRGSNMVKALDDNCLDCVAHILNTVLRHTFNEKKLCPESVHSLLNECKSLVRYVKKGSLQNLLPGSLKQAIDTRWNSKYTMLVSIERQFNSVQQVFLQHAPTEMRRLIGIDVALVSELTKFLKLFFDTTQELQGQHEPTIQKVLPCMQKLKLHCAPDDTDSNEVAVLRSTALSFLEDKFNAQVTHKVAVFLNPRQRSMKALPPADRVEVMNYVNEQLDMLPLVPTPPQPPSTEEPPAKRNRVTPSCEFDDDVNDETPELTRYLNADVTAEACADILACLISCPHDHTCTCFIGGISWVVLCIGCKHNANTNSNTLR